jgi:hypothetical protein
MIRLGPVSMLPPIRCAALGESCRGAIGSPWAAAAAGSTPSRCHEVSDLI